jgi:hypothetical protein
VNINRRVTASFLLASVFVTTAGCSKKTQQPAVGEQQAQEQAVLAYRKLIEESKARVAAASASVPAPAKAEPEVVDPYQVERWLSNLGYQRNLAARIRQDINLLALLVPEMGYFAQAGRYDKAYLATGLLNKPLVDITSKALAAATSTRELNQANSVIIADPFRSFVIEFSSSFYEGRRFLKFLSEPLAVSQWRIDAIIKFNQLVAFDRTQTAIFRAVAPVLMSRFPIKEQSSRKALIEKLSATLALYRTAWAMKEMTDEQVYRLIASISKPETAATFGSTAEAIDSACVALGAEMNSLLPATLSPKTTSPLAAMADASPAARN